MFKRPDGKEMRLTDWKQVQAVLSLCSWKEEQSESHIERGVC